MLVKALVSICSINIRKIKGGFFKGAATSNYIRTRGSEGMCLGSYKRDHCKEKVMLCLMYRKGRSFVQRQQNTGWLFIFF